MSVIKDFQSKYGLTADGIIGKNTLLKIKEILSIKSDEMLAHFMGQCHVESAGFTAVTENLNYSSQGLLGTFPNYFNKDSAPLYQHNPEKIANNVYANRMGNGNELSGDGWKHRGMGLIQLTGKQNQDLFSNYIKDPVIKTDPSIIATKYPFESAKFYFDNKHLWTLCSTVNEVSITALSYRVNGGTNGLEERIEWTNHYYNILK
jgi:putative chitinase